MSITNQTEGGNDVGLCSKPLNAIDFCAGSGIGSLVFRAIGLCRTVLYVEKDPYCQRLIQQRIEDGWLDNAPIWDDAKTFDGRPWRGLVDFVFGGIPCQPWSVAGQRKGTADERDLWPDFMRVVREVGPEVVLVENVPGLLAASHVRDGMGRVLGELAEAGYDAEWTVLGADDVGAPHRRKRVWVVAYARRPRRREDARSTHGNEGADERWPAQETDESDGHGERHRTADVADASGEGLALGQGQSRDNGPECAAAERDGWWQSEPDVGRVAHGVASRVDRLRTLGNGWVPQVAAVVGRRIMQAIETEDR